VVALGEPSRNVELDFGDGGGDISISVSLISLNKQICLNKPATKQRK
jgi:hypothetical protein